MFSLHSSILSYIDGAHSLSPTIHLYWWISLYTSPLLTPYIFLWLSLLHIPPHAFPWMGPTIHSDGCGHYLTVPSYICLYRFVLPYISPCVSSTFWVPPYISEGGSPAHLSLCGAYYLGPTICT